MKTSSLVGVASVLAIAGLSGNTASAQDATRLVQKYACNTCHSAETKVNGPSYSDIAKKYRDQKGIEAKIGERIQKGSFGVWGQIPMPPTHMTEKEALTLAKWVLSPKSPSPAATPVPRTVVIGTLADTVLEWRGKATASVPVGQDQNGHLVEWRYPDATYLMARRLQGGVEAYRVIKITPK